MTNITVLKAFTMNALNKKITLLFITITILFGLKSDLKAQRLDISGDVSYFRLGNLVTLNAGRVDHYVNPFYYQSGTLYLQLWTCLTPYNGLQTSLGYKVAEATIDPLWAGYFYSNVSQTVPFFAPPDGTYYMVMVLAESDGFQRLTVDWHNFSNTETFGYVPPPPPVVTPPSIVSQPASVSVTAGASASFSVSAAGTSPSYQWYKNGSPISGATGVSHTISNAQASDAGNYTVTVFNTAGSVSSNAATLTVNTPPPPPPVVTAPSITSQPASVSVTAGASASFSVSAAGTSPSYQWYKNGSPISGATGVSYTIPSAQASDAGNYTVTVFNTAGSVSSNAATLTVAPPPVSITSDLSTVSVPIKKLIPRFTITTNFGAKSFAAKGLPKGLKLNAKNGVISGKPTKAGTYTVTLTARKMKGKKVEQQATATKVVIVY